ncbi:ParB N-terminal domain-containing protein [Patescibacteria group bacterium]|nr:ParB N-terminal domain-containing protein [Patescibacteria group bacterium]
MIKNNLSIEKVEIDELNSSEYNPRYWSDIKLKELKDSISKFGLVDAIIVNSAPNRKNIVIGGRMRLFVCKELGYKTIPVIYLNIPDIEKEKDANKFVAELLMPKWLLEKDVTNFTSISELARKYIVSGQSMSIRLLETKLIDKIKI